MLKNRTSACVSAGEDNRMISNQSALAKLSIALNSIRQFRVKRRLLAHFFQFSFYCLECGNRRKKICSTQKLGKVELKNTK